MEDGERGKTVVDEHPASQCEQPGSGAQLSHGRDIISFKDLSGEDWLNAWLSDEF